MRIAACLEYDGARFHGWQSQPQGNTVQDAVEAAVAAIAGVPARVQCAGRTDAGVHALVQLVHFDVPAERPASAWVRGVNGHLPAAVAVRWAQPVADGFHARFSAISRTYRYLLYNGATRPGLNADRVGWFHQPLALEAMREGLGLAAGTHDFSAFRAAECQAKTPVKTLHEARIDRHGQYLVFTFRADAFLHHMVRNLVGALVAIGKGAHPPRWVGELLEHGDRRLGAATFSAAGLYLAGVEYDPDWRLPDGGRIIAPPFLAVA